ncbi:unnamed protein product [Pleuronectes platessa]|uniref:Uncharacterized protein n=1 Tax=Pleuronectes platessa TaxID=8262 RepID=A0A9N7VNP0_PLEPL|nr:unnamed protein product [Pleuronectes platessa]
MATRSAIQENEMAAHQKMTLRVILTEADIRKVILNTRPTTVKDLIDELKESLGFDYNCCLQYQDPDFNYELCNLTHIADLPEKPTLKVIPILELLSVSMSDDILNDTHSTADTEILSRSSQERQKHWPEQFEIPGAHSAEGEPAKKNIKKAKKGELNYLPNFPEGFDQLSLEGARKDLVDEMQKREPNGKPVKQMMDLTFALRRKEVVDSEPAITTMMERWPALFTEDQIYMEFRRIVGKDLKKEFFDGIDQHSPRLVEIFRCKRGIIGQQLTQLSQETKTTEPTDIRTMMLRGLPILLQDNPNDFFKACFDSDDDDSYQHIDIGILLVEQEGAMLSSSMHLYPASLKIIIEGKVVMGNIEDLPRAVCLLFGLAYALHLNYPKSMKHTFQFIQQDLSRVPESPRMPHQ